MASKAPVVAFASTKAPRVAARPPEDPAIAAAQQKLDTTLLHTAPCSHEYSDVRDLRRPAGVPMPFGTQLKATSALRPARARFGPAEEILHGISGSGTHALGTTAATAIFGQTAPMDQLGATLDAFAPLPIDPATQEPAVDAEVRRLAQRLEATGQLESSTKKVRSPVGTVKRLLQDDIPSVPKSSYADELKHTAEKQALLLARDKTHTFRVNDERRYEEARRKTVHMLGSKGKSAPKPPAA